MGIVRLGAPRDLCTRLRDKFNVSTFVETGTYKGETSRWAAGEFERVYTTEAYPPYWEKAKARHADCQNIEFILGDSRTQLKPILDKLDRPALFWLDAHWMGSLEIGNATPGGECPLREELDALNQSDHNHIILIDDARLFVGRPGAPFDEKQWPTYDEICGLLTARHPRKVFVFEDVIIAVPPEGESIVLDHTGGGSLVVHCLTSNAYVHAIPGFAYLFNKFWSDDQGVKILRYDVRNPKLHLPNFHVIAIGKQADHTWSSGLRGYLEGLAHAGETHILLMLEDYYLSTPVDRQAVKALHAYALDNPEVAKIDLSGDRLKFPHTEHPTANSVPVVLSADDALFQTSIQAAIWRIDYLLRFLVDSETPWQFEKAGTRRVIAAREAGTFDGKILGTSRAVLNYVNAIGGEGTKPGEYDRRKFPPALWAELEAKGLVR